MNYLHYLSSNPELKTQKIRDAILSSDFSDYCTAVKKAESIKEDLIKLEETIFGTCSDIDIYSDIFFQYKMHGRVIISPIFNTITVNIHHFTQYGNGCILQQEHVESKTCNFDTLIPSYTNIMQTLRRLHNKKTNKIKSSIKEYTHVLFENFKATNPNEFAEGHRPCLDIMFNPEIRDIYSKAYELEKFWNIFIANIDTISFISESLNSHTIDFNDLTLELIAKIKSNLNGVSNLLKLPSSSEIYTNYIKNYNNISESTYDVLEFFNIIQSELLEQDEELKKHPQYKEMLTEYLSIQEKIIIFENTHFN